MAVEIDAIQSAKSIGWTDALLSRLAANSVGLGGRLSITAPANASALSSTGYSLTGSDATSMVDLAGTWNTTGTPTAIKLNITDTASNAASLLMDLQVGGTSQFNLVKGGLIRTTVAQSNSTITSGTGDTLRINNTSSQSKITFAFSGTIRGGIRVDSSGNFNWHSTGSQCHQFYANTGDVQSFSGSGLCVNAQPGGVTDIQGISVFGSIGFRAGGGTTNPTDVILTRDAANTLALRNGANAQAFNIYGTYTSGSVYERAFMRYSVANTRFEIGAETLGGTAGNTGLAFFTNGASRLTINTTGTAAFSVGATFGDHTVLGTSLRAGGSTYVQINQTNQIGFTSTTTLTSAIDIGLKRTIAGVVGITDGSTGGGAIGMQEQTAPAAPAANGVYIYAEDNGSGKTRLMALFASGAAQEISIEP